jgi:hypothetical protein
MGDHSAPPDDRSAGIVALVCLTLVLAAVIWAVFGIYVH